MGGYAKLLTAVCLLLSLFAKGLPAFAVSAVSAPVTLIVEAPDQTLNSSTVTVCCKLWVPENVRVDGLNAVLSFDANAFALRKEKLIPGELLGTATFSQNNGGIAVLYEQLGSGLPEGEHILFTAVFDIKNGQKEQEYPFDIAVEECYHGILEGGAFQGFADLPTETYGGNVFLGERFSPSAQLLRLAADTAVTLTFNKPVKSWQNHNGELFSYDLEKQEVRGIKPGRGAITFISENNEQCTVLVEISEKPQAMEHITSSVYSITGDQISKIPQKTKVSFFLSQINEKQYLAVYKADGKPAAGSDDIGTGFVVKLMNGTAVARSYQVSVTGDVNGDGKITAADYVNVKFHVLNRITLSGVYSVAADANGDGKITAADYVNIKFDVLNKSGITPR